MVARFVRIARKQHLNYDGFLYLCQSAYLVQSIGLDLQHELPELGGSRIFTMSLVITQLNHCTGDSRRARLGSTMRPGRQRSGLRQGIHVG